MQEYCVWLIPAEPWLGKFRSIIENIAKENNTFSFEPHITILIKGEPDAQSASKHFEEDKMIKVAEELAKQITKTTARLTEIAYENTYFRALYIKAQREYRNTSSISGNSLFQIHTNARKLCGMLADPYYTPHLSLLYGNLDEKAKKQIIKNINLKANDAYASIHLPMEVEFDKITLWRTGADIPVNEWKKVTDISCRK